MKILLCHNYYRQPGGEDQSFAAEARLLAAHGYEIVQYTLHNRAIATLPLWQVASKTLWNRAAYAELRELCRRERPEILHCTNTFPLMSPAVYYAAREEGVRVVQALRNYRLLCPNALFLRNHAACEKCLAKRLAWPAVWHGCYRGSRTASAVVAAMLAWHHWRKTWSDAVNVYYTPSEFARQKFIAGGLPAHKVLVKPNFLDPDPGPGAGDGGYVAFVGRLAEEKGIRTLLAAWRKFSDDIRLKIVGNGPLAPLVREAAKDDCRITWLGQRSTRELLPLVAHAALLVFPSVWYETFGRTIMEAFACGTPVLASRMGAMTELVEEGRTGVLFKPGDADDLAARLTEHWRAPRRLAVMRVEARREFEVRFTGAANIEQLRSIYEHALSGEHLQPSCSP